ncbi:MAG: family 78 glycoside hydrolase catalytic domain [Gemmataceae bacterium]
MRLTIVALLALAVVARAAPLAPTRLRTEALTDPLGIGTTSPRLTWIVESAEPNQRQTAYRILVASTPEKLAADAGDLWDTGKSAGDETLGHAYAGKPLKAFDFAVWKVMVWDKDGRPSGWSEPARFSVGPLTVADWGKAVWIGSPRPRPDGLVPAPLDGAKWVWKAGESAGDAPKGMRVFLTSFDLPDMGKVAKVEVIAAASGKYWFVLNAENVIVDDPTGKPHWPLAQEATVTHNCKAGPNAVRVQVENAQPGPAGLIAKIRIAFVDGTVKEVATSADWRATDNPGANWHRRDIRPDEWPAAAAVASPPWKDVKLKTMVLPPPAYLRTTFQVTKPVKRATLYTTALGVYDLRGLTTYGGNDGDLDDYFSPGWSDYTKRVNYRTYDVTRCLVRGVNVLPVVLADGWYSGHIGWKKIRDHYGIKPRFKALLRLEYSDGTAEVVTTGPEWRSTVDGPIREADFLMGETHDLAKSVIDWAIPSFDASKWDAVATGAEVNPAIQAHPGPPIRAESQSGERVSQPKPGVYVFDVGQNLAGMAHLESVRGRPGQRVMLRFAERLNPDGTIYTANLRDARATDSFTFAADHAAFRPKFTFHGFQYVEVTGLSGPPVTGEQVMQLRAGTELARNVSGLISVVTLSSDTPRAGSFECSDPTLNKLASNIYYTQRANFIDIPTDCPQRDERLGWTGDAQVYARTATLNADVQAFMTKWLVDLTDAQRPDGQFPMVAPLKVAEADGGPAWADAGVIVPWTMYEVYGDRRLLERQYPSMAKFIAFCKGRSTPDLLPPAKYHCFGDWLSIGADTPKDVIYTAYFAYSTKLTAKAAAALGKVDDAKQYEELFQRIRAAFNKAYVKDGGRIHGDTQCCYVLALAFDLLDDDKAKLAAGHLVADIEAKGNHLSTGFIGTKDLMLVLAKVGRNDVAYRLIHQDTFPGWGFSIKHGATSIWERWDGWTPEKGFQTPGMNSFAHYSFGAVYQWMVENIGGIRAGDVAYKRIVIAPQPGGKLTWAKVGYDSVRGKIATDWKLDGDKFRLTVTIPANTTAQVRMPKSGKMIEVGSGVHTFEE